MTKLSDKKTVRQASRSQQQQSAPLQADAESSLLEDGAEFIDAEDNAADDDQASTVDVGDIDVVGEDEDELVADEETQSVEQDEATQRYAHESEVFGKKELSTSREKLELLREERALREMLGDSF